MDVGIVLVSLPLSLSLLYCLIFWYLLWCSVVEEKIADCEASMREQMRSGIVLSMVEAMSLMADLRTQEGGGNGDRRGLVSCEDFIHVVRSMTRSGDIVEGAEALNAQLVMRAKASVKDAVEQCVSLYWSKEGR